MNLKEKYNWCLLPTMIMEGPRSIKEQEERDQEEARPTLMPEEEEIALTVATKNLEARLK